MGALRDEELKGWAELVLHSVKSTQLQRSEKTTEKDLEFLVVANCEKINILENYWYIRTSFCQIH